MPDTNLPPAIISAPEDDEFDWSDDSLTYVCHAQPRTVVYHNRRGQVVIRQEADGYHDDDNFVFFNTEYLPALIEAPSAAALSLELLEHPAAKFAGRARPRLD